MSEVKVAVVIPCYNTSAACVDVITRARTAADALLVVDDGSTDDTPGQISSTGCLCLRLPINLGKGAALKAGIEEVLKGRLGLLGDDFDYVLTIDGDGQHDPADIARFVTLAREVRPDVVLGVRDVRAMPPKSKIGNYFSREVLVMLVKQPLALTETAEKFDITATVEGGGGTGQAGAVRHGISRALLEFNGELRERLKSAGFLTRDDRKKERKKYGQPGARKRFQFSKR